MLTALSQLCGGVDKMIDITIAIDKLDKIGLEKIKEQCFYYQELMGIKNTGLIAGSYSDMLLVKKSSLS